MEGFWITLAWGLVSLLAVSVLVALVEFARQGGTPRPLVESPLPRAVRVDVDLETLDAPGHDLSTRRVALTEVLQRLQQGAADAPWTETTPMVLAHRAEGDGR
jgi:hypothetical protein